jgi:hypothetical protein
MKMIASRSLYLLLALMIAPPVINSVAAGPDRAICGPKKKGNGKRNTKNNNQNNVNRNREPRIVGRRTGNLPPLSTKAPKNIQTKPYEPPAHVATLGSTLKTYKPKQTRALRIVGRVQRTVESKTDPHSGEKEDAEGYSLNTTLGEVLLSSTALQRGGQIIDLRPYVGHRIRVTGDGYFKDEHANKGLIFEAIRRIETE